MARGGPGLNPGVVRLDVGGGRARVRTGERASSTSIPARGDAAQEVAMLVDGARGVTIRSSAMLLVVASTWIQPSDGVPVQAASRPVVAAAGSLVPAHTIPLDATDGSAVFAPTIWRGLTRIPEKNARDAVAGLTAGRAPRPPATAPAARGPPAGRCRAWRRFAAGATGSWSPCAPSPRRPHAGSCPRSTAPPPGSPSG